VYIQYSKFRAHSVFQGKRKLLKIPECKKYIQYSEIFRANSVFQLTSKVITEFAYNGTSRIRNVIAELTLYANWNACKRCLRDRSKCNVIDELTLQMKWL